MLSAAVTTLASFNGTDGNGPVGGLTLSGGKLYGETENGGPNYIGTVFSIPVAGGTPTDVASFGGSVTGSPYGGLTISGNTLYGTATYAVGFGDDGYVFSLAATGGTPSFVADMGDRGGNDARPLIVNGTLYDSIFNSGGAGAVVSTPLVGPSNATFLGYFGQSDGVSPESGLVSSGNTLYGATNSGGSNNDGVIFSIPIGGGTPAVLGSFNGTNGANPAGDLVLSGNMLYGTTSSGGDNNDGTVFSLPITGGTPNVLASFDGTNGLNPSDGVTLWGNTLYGTAPIGGPYSDAGVFFSVPITGGTPKVQASFNSGVPVGGLILSGNTFYGTTSDGGTGYGTIFEITGAMATPVIAVTAPSNQTATAGTAASFSLGSFSQTNATAPYSVDVKWGDGSADTVFSEATVGAISPQSHTFANAGTDVISVKVTDALNFQSNTASFNVSIGAQVKAASISGIEYEDANDNGVYGSGDVTVAGLQVYIDSNGNGVLDTGEPVASTDIGGNYSFLNLQPGTYVLRPVLLTNWYQTEPANGAGRMFTLIAGENLTGQDFGQGISQLGAISGTVFADSNGNSKMDSGEVGLANVEVFIDVNGNGTADTGEPALLTSSTGTFSFSNLSAGTYQLRELTPSNYKLGSPAAGYASVTVAARQTTTGVLFADVPIVTTPAKLSGTAIGTSGSYQNDGNTIAKALDGNLTTFFDGPTANGNWVGLDLGSPMVITSLAYASRSGYASRMNGGIFQASNTVDFSSGVVALYTIGANANPSSGSLTTQTVSNSTSYRYVRYLSPANSDGDVAEVQFFGYTPVVQLPSWLSMSNGSVYNYSSSGLTVTSGTALILGDPSSTAANFAITALGTSTVQFWSTARIGTLTLNDNSVAMISGTGATLAVTSLSLSALAKLDLKTSSLIVDYVAGSSPQAAIVGYLKSGLSGNGSAGLLTSAYASPRLVAPALLDNALLTTLGNGFTTFEGVTVDSTSLLIKYTYFGDSNFDGKVDGSDYTRIDSGYLTRATGWYNGDFNYDGVVNGSDYTLIDNAFNSQGTTLADQVQMAGSISSHRTGHLAAPTIPPVSAFSGGLEFWTEKRKKAVSLFAE